MRERGNEAEKEGEQIQDMPFWVGHSISQKHSLEFHHSGHLHRSHEKYYRVKGKNSIC